MNYGKTPVIYLIRHARSVYNTAEANLIKQFPNLSTHEFQQTPKYLNMKWNLDYQDCDIAAEHDHAECYESRDKMKDIDVDLIIVSPMKRALATCHKIFTGHKSSAPVIVDPLFREIMQSSCDIGSRLRESMKDYPNFDYSLAKNIDHWYIDTLSNEKQKAQLLEKLKDVDASDLNLVAQKAMLEYLQRLWKKRGEDASLKSQALSPFHLQKQKLKMLLQKYKSIAIVTHSENIKSYVGQKPPNCAILAYRPQYFDLKIEEVPKDYL